MRVNIIKILIAVFFLSFGALSLFRYWQEQIRERRVEDFAIAHMHHEEGRYKEAVRKFGKIVEFHPGSKEAISSLYYLGISLIQLEDYEEAVYYFQRLKDEFACRHYLPGTIYHWAQAEEKRGRLEESFSLYESIRRDFPRSSLYPNALIGMGRISEAKGRWEVARGYFQEAMDSFPQTEVFVQAKRKLGELNINLLTSPVTMEHCIIHEVVPGDTLNAIAAKFDITVALIMKRNNLKSHAIKPMQRLRIFKKNFHVVADVSENTLTLYANGEFIVSYPTATGTPDTPTPLGEFVIINRLIDPQWRGIPHNDPANILGTRWLGLNKPGYGIHGTTKPETIGTHATLGCIRMFNEDVEELFDFVPVGTIVRIIE